MTENVENVTDATESVSTEERFEQWRAALESTPSREHLSSLAEEAQAAREQLAEADRAYQHAVVQRGCTHGFGVVAEEIGVSARQVHVWAKQFPELVDLSDAPKHEIAKQMQLTQRAQREGGEALSAQLDRHQATLAAIREGMDK